MEKNIPSGIEELKIFWLLLTLMGIHTDQRKEAKKRCFQNVISLPFIIFFVWCLLICLIFYFDVFKHHDRKQYLTATSMTYLGSAIFAYVSLLRKRSHLRMLRKSMGIFPIDGKLSGVFWMLYAMILMTIIKPELYALSSLFYGAEDMPHFEIFSYENETVRRAFSVVNAIILFFVEETTPFVLNFVFCAICHYWQQVIATTKVEISKYGRRFPCADTPCSLMSLLERCHCLWHTTRLMRDTFSSFLTGLTAFFVMSMFLNTFLIAKEPGEKLVDIHHKINLGFCLVCFTCCVYFASKVPEQMEELLTTLAELYGNTVFQNGEHKELQKPMEAILMRKPIALSAGQWVEMRKTLIFVTIGSVLSYGLLVIENA